MIRRTVTWAFVLIGWVAPTPALAYVTFTASYLASGGLGRVTATVGIQDCAFDESLVAQVAIIGKPFGVPGSDSAISVQAGQQDCHLYQKYLVSTLDTTEKVGQQILVQHNEGPRNGAEFNDQEHWFLAISNDGESNHWFNGIYGHYLFIDDGCCPGPRRMEIYVRIPAIVTGDSAAS